MQQSNPNQAVAYSALEEQFNVLTHLLGFILSIVGLFVLLFKTNGIVETLSGTIFGASMVLLFGASTFYHWATDPKLKPVLKRADHIAIYVLIAGTYSPFLVVSINGWVSTVSIITIWTVAFIGIGFKAIFKDRFPKLAIATYAIMGWLALIIIVPIYKALPFGGFLLLVLGGVSYSLGIPFYMAKQKRFTHAIWHIFVLVGAACHYFAIYFYVLRGG